MSYSITREDGTADAMALQDALNILKASKSWDSPATARLRELRDSIEEQVKPVPISEPDGFGSVVRAFVCGSNAEPWVRVRAGQFSEWANEHGSHVDWHRLCEPEVLRIGVGEAAPVVDRERIRRAVHYELDCINGRDARSSVLLEEDTDVVTDSVMTAMAGVDALFTEGFDAACNEILKDLNRLRAELITAPEQSALDKAIAAVEHQRSWK